LEAYTDFGNCLIFVKRTSIYNLCILLVEVGSSGNKDGGKE